MASWLPITGECPLHQHLQVAIGLTMLGGADIVDGGHHAGICSTSNETAPSAAKS